MKNNKPFIKSIIIFSTTELYKLLEVNLGSPLWSSVGKCLSYFFNWSFLFHLFGQLEQVSLIDVPFSLLIQWFEDSDKVIFSVLFIRLDCEEFDELSEINLSSVICIKYRHCDIDKFPSGIVATELSDTFS